MSQIGFRHNLMQQYIAIGQQRIETAIVQSVDDDLIEIGQAVTLSAALLQNIYDVEGLIAMIFHLRRSIFLLAVILLIVACKDQSRNGYVELAGRVFIFNPRVGEATYVVSLTILKDLPKGARIKAKFENPAGGETIEVNEIVRVVVSKIAIESPPLSCIKKDRRYAFEITLSDADGAVLQTISSSIKSSLDQSILPDAPLVVGPGYEPNLELKGNPAGKLPGGPKIPCPA